MGERMAYLPPLRTLPELPSPIEILETEPCKDYYIKVVKWEIGRLIIRPRWLGAPPQKEVVCIRIWTTEKYKPTWPPYWDITPARLVSQLYALLREGIPEGYVLKIHRDIPGPKAHFSISLVKEEEIETV